MSDYVDVMSRGFESELQKIAQANIGTKALSMAKSPQFLLPAAGIAGWELLRKANTDRKLGREIRVRSGR